VADPEQVYLAASLREARDVEALLTSSGVNYATQVEVLGRSSLFGSLRHAAGFYVSAAQAEYCRIALEAGFSSGIIQDGHARRIDSRLRDMNRPGLSSRSSARCRTWQFLACTVVPVR
jgi:hypothetical protein